MLLLLRISPLSPLESFPNSPYSLRGVPSPQFHLVSPLTTELSKLRRSWSTKGFCGELPDHSAGDAHVFAQVLRPWLLHGFLIRNGISVQRDLLRANGSSGPISVSSPRLLVVKLLPVRRFVDSNSTPVN
jgi:hypothetical protein